MPRISQLPSLTTADNADEVAIVDVSASTTKKITRGDLLKAPLPTKSVTLPAINGGTTAGVLTTDASGNVSAIPASEVIYAGVSGTTGTVTLSKAITNFAMILIEAKHISSNTKGSVLIRTPAVNDNIAVSVQRGDGGNLTTHAMKCQFTSTTALQIVSGSSSAMTSTGQSGYLAINEIVIASVTGIN